MTGTLRSHPLASRFLFSLAALALASCGGAGQSGPADSPDGQPGNTAPTDNTRPPYPTVNPNGQIQGEGNFATLIKRASQGKTGATPWAGYWWPYETNGISNAASRYDQARGGGTAASWERSNHGAGVPGLESWFGHCNGWAAAAVLYREPRAAATAGSQSFPVAEQKAILSELAMEVRADFFGSRNEDNNSSSQTFQDVAPDVFFLVLTNYVGNGLGLIIDRYTGNQVWNHPLAGYRISPIRPADSLGPAPGNPDIHRVNVTTQVWWVRDDVEGGHLTEPFAFEDGQSYESRTFRYEVWLDAPPVFDGAGNLASAGKVVVARQGNSSIGGAWRNSGLELFNSHPDYIWVPHAVTPSTGYSNPGIDAAFIESTFGRRNPST